MRTETAKSTRGPDEGTIATLTADLRTKRQAHADIQARRAALLAQSGSEGDAVRQYEAIIELDGIQTRVLMSKSEAQKAERLLAAAVEQRRAQILVARRPEYVEKIRALNEKLAEAQQAATDAAAHNDETGRLTDGRTFTPLGWAAGLLDHPDSAYSTWQRIMAAEGFLQR